MFLIEVSDDRLSAFIKCCKLGGYSAITPGRIVALLESSRTEVTDQVTERIKSDVEPIKGEQDKILQRTRPLKPPGVEVETRAHKGATIYFDEYVCAIESELRGSVLIRLVERKGRREITAFNVFTNTRKVLASRKCSASELAAGRDSSAKTEQAVCTA